MLPELKSEEIDLENIDEKLKDDIWPRVIAVGFLSEFYFQFLATEVKVLEIY